MKIVKKSGMKLKVIIKLVSNPVCAEIFDYIPNLGRITLRKAEGCFARGKILSVNRDRFLKN